MGSKRVIHKPEEHKMETVKLVKQQFEPLPTNEQEEMTTRAMMTKADKPIKPIKEKPKKKKKAKAKADKVEDEPEELPEELPKEESPQKEETPEDTPQRESSPEKRESSVSEESEKPEPMDVDEDEEPAPKDDKSKPVKEELEIIDLKKIPQEVVVEEVERTRPDEKEPVFVGMKLRKATRIKHTFNGPELEMPELVSHKDEPEQCYEEEEMETPRVALTWP